MAKKAKCECPPPGSPSWMATFSDMATLLLTFFVLLLSMATFEPTKFAMTVSSLQGAFGILESFPTVAIHPIVKIPRKSGDESKRKHALEDAQKVKEVIESKNLDDAVKVEITDKGMAILLRDPVGFASGSADLKEQGKMVLNDISQIIKKNDNLNIRVEGHTDDVPISTSRYRSNWELSTARSLSVVELLSEATGIKPANMSAVGYGEYRPMVPNTSTENRGLNRRIKIFVDYLDKPASE
jgi:chemotaxis protein MotB